MKGEKGVCIAGSLPTVIRRTKFDTQKNAQIACNFHIEAGFIATDYVVYQCTACDTWHFGKPEWVKQFGKQ